MINDTFSPVPSFTYTHYPNKLSENSIIELSLYFPLTTLLSLSYGNYDLAKRLI